MNCKPLAIALLVLVSITVLAQTPAAGPRAPYRDSTLAVDARVADLLSRMTLEEKIAQLCPSRVDYDKLLDQRGNFSPDKAAQLIPATGSAMFGRLGRDRGPRQTAVLYNALQKYLIERTRLGIPAFFTDEALHGYMAYRATGFPQALGLASTWDPDLVREIFTAAADEMRSRGGNYAFTPVLDLAREPRWGRTEETYGEDPYLISRIGVAAIQGLQGTSERIDKHHVLATAKHFAAHGMPEAGTNSGPANYSEHELREAFLPAFEAAVREAGVASIMASYNEIDGVPAHVNSWLLDRVLRQDWGFRGFVTSDGGALPELVRLHHVAADNAEAARKALAAGVDFDLSSGDVYRTLLAQVQQGAVPQAMIDRAVARLLQAKFNLGLFDSPYVDPDYAERITNSAEHRALALRAAQKSIVLLKNEHNLMPLDLSRIRTIAVIGPNAADYHPGGYSVDPGRAVPILDGIRQYLGTRANVAYAEGCKITTTVQGWRAWWEDKVELADPATQQASIQEAVRVVKSADVALVVVGENEGTNREGWSQQHLGDRDSLDLLGAQDALIRAVVDTGTPTIVLLINGRPLSINYAAEHVPAILEGWYLGQEGGTAVAQVLFGEVNPGGKLPISFPRSVGQLPVFYNHKPSARRGYLFTSNTPLFPFGHGLSYTTFKFANLRVEPRSLTATANAIVRVDVTNTGSRAGDEVAQLYIHQRLASVTRPVKELKAFRRVSLKPGENQTIEFTIGPSQLSMLNQQMQRVVEPGAFDIMVGPSSAQLSTIELQVAEAP